MLSKFSRHIATVVAITIGALGVVGILYAWRLPPFTSTVRMTDDAYVKGQVTFLAPQLSGLVEEVAVQDYQRVKAGDLLVQLDARTYRESLAQAQAQLEAAQASLDSSEQARRSAEASLASAQAGVVSARASLAQQEADLKRARELKQRGVITAQDLEQEELANEQAKAALHQAEAGVETATQSLASVVTGRKSLEASVDQARAAVKLAQINLDNTTVTAPVDGRLGEVSARVGQYVSAGSNLATIVPDRIWVVANFKETQLSGMHLGQPVQFTVDALGGAELNGRVERFAPAMGSEFSVMGTSNAAGNFIKIAHRLPVRIAIDADQPLSAQLVPGMSVVARVDTAAAPLPADTRSAREEPAVSGAELGWPATAGEAPVKDRS